MTTVEQAQPDQPSTADEASPKQGVLDRLRRDPSTRDIVIYLVGIAAVSALIRAVLVSLVDAPTVFSDELIYSKLAQSIGQTGHLGLLSDRGFSYSPLYPLALAPVYALGVSAHSAYALIRAINVVMMALAIVPTYKIARFVLPRRPSLLVAGLSAVAPVFAYSSFVMTENLAYPVCLLSIWALLEAMSRPSPGKDVLVLVTIVVAVAARIQLVVLVPVALTAIVLAAALETIAARDRAPIRRTLSRAASRHPVLLSVGAILAAAGVAALSVNKLFTLAGGYSAIGQRGFPNVADLLELLGRHAAALQFAVGLVPFAGTLLAAYAFFRLRMPIRFIPFASVSISLTAWLLLEAAFQAAQFDSGPDANIARIHERFYIYVIPLFLVGLVAALRLPREKVYARAALGASVVAIICAAVIPYGTVINNTIGFESIGLQMMARVQRGGLAVVPHATLFAIWLTASLTILYSRVRYRTAFVVCLVVIPFLVTWVLETDRIHSSSVYARRLLPVQSDWIDRAHPAGDVAVLTGRQPATAELETTFANLSIDRVYYLCQLAFGGSFGEEAVTVRPSGVLAGPRGALRVAYVVAPTSLGVRGRVVAQNRRGHEVLVAPANRLVRLAPGATRSQKCAPAHRRRT